MNNIKLRAKYEIYALNLFVVEKDIDEVTFNKINCSIIEIPSIGCGLIDLILVEDVTSQYWNQKFVLRFKSDGLNKIKFHDNNLYINYFNYTNGGIKC